MLTYYSRYSRRDACCRAFVAQLLRVFGRTASDSDCVAPYCGGVVFDWTRDAPFVGMAYSSPSFRSTGLSATQHYEALGSPDYHVGRFWSVDEETKSICFCFENKI